MNAEEGGNRRGRSRREGGGRKGGREGQERREKWTTSEKDNEKKRKQDNKNLNTEKIRVSMQERKGREGREKGWSGRRERGRERGKE